MNRDYLPPVFVHPAVDYISLNILNEMERNLSPSPLGEEDLVHDLASSRRVALIARDTKDSSYLGHMVIRPQWLPSGKPKLLIESLQGVEGKDRGMVWAELLNQAPRNYPWTASNLFYLEVGEETPTSYLNDLKAAGLYALKAHDGLILFARKHETTQQDQPTTPPGSGEGPQNPQPETRRSRLRRD